jgi:hypothetical protein
MNFAEHTFYAAVIFGLIALLPQYYLETKNEFDFSLPNAHGARGFAEKPYQESKTD